jgi:hypothetical protein
MKNSKLSQFLESQEVEYNIETVIDEYKDEIVAFANYIWSQTPTAQKNPHLTIPEWFKETMLKRGNGFLSLAYSTGTNWIVFPEYANGFSMVVFKKQNHKDIQKIERLKTRYYNDPKDAKMANDVAKKSISSINVKQINKIKNVIKVEDNNIVIFSFPSNVLKFVLIALGAPDEMIRLATKEVR